MIDHRGFRRLRLGARVAPALVAVSCLTLVVDSGSAAAKQKAQRHAGVASSKMVMACLRKDHLKDITASSKSLWVAWVPTAQSFVYVQKYATTKQALAEARFLRDEESGLSTKLVITQHIAPYSGSPVPTVVKCLGGRMISKKAKPGGAYKF